MRKAPSKTHPASADDVSSLIKARRTELGWSLAVLAKRAALRSPAYVFHIENGHKTPSPGVAARLANALGLDEQVLRAWAVARGRSGLDRALQAAATVSRFLGVEEQNAAAAPAAPRHPLRDDISEPDTHWLDVPVLAEGADPDPPSGPAPAPIETLRLDRRLFPALAPGARVFAYRLSAHGVRRVSDLLRPGDCVVVLHGADSAVHDAPCAVRIDGRVVISRVHVRDGAVHLPSGSGAPDSADPDARAAPDATATIVGRVAIAFRRWL